MKIFSIRPALIATGLVLGLVTSAAQGQTIVIDDFSTGFGGLPDNPIMVDGVASVFDELFDLAPVGSIGDRHEWISGFNFQYPGIPNHLYVTGASSSILPEVMIFGGFDYNLEFGLDYTPSSGAPAFDLTVGGGNAFALDVIFSDIPSAPMTITVVTGTGTGSLSVDTLLSPTLNVVTYLFHFDSFSGTPDFADVQSISWSFLTVNEFGPDALFDNFEVVAAPAPLFLTVPSLVGGTTSTLLVSGATPNQNVYFVYSAVGLGSTFIPALNLNLDLLSPNLAGAAMANGSGDASLPSTIPNAASGLSVYLQAVQFQKKSGLALRVIL